MTEPQQQAIDFTMMYVTHNALRRDMSRFATVMATGRAVSPGVRAGWQNFKAQLHVHHTVEDDDLWPRLYRAVNDRPEDVAIDTLIGTLDAHLEHEKSALPLIQAVLTPADWRAFGSAMRRRQGSRARRSISLGSSTARHQRTAIGFSRPCPQPCR